MPRAISAFNWLTEIEMLSVYLRIMPHSDLVFIVKKFVSESGKHFSNKSIESVPKVNFSPG